MTSQSSSSGQGVVEERPNVDVEAEIKRLEEKDRLRGEARSSSHGSGGLPQSTFSGFMSKVEKHMATMPGAGSQPGISHEKAMELIEIQGKALLEAQAREREAHDVITAQANMVRGLTQHSKTADDRIRKLEEQMQDLAKQIDQSFRVGAALDSEGPAMVRGEVASELPRRPTGSPSGASTPRRQFHAEDAVGALAERTHALMQADMLMAGELRKQQADVSAVQASLNQVLERLKNLEHSRHFAGAGGEPQQRRSEDTAVLRNEITRLEENLRRCLVNHHEDIDSKLAHYDSKVAHMEDHLLQAAQRMLADRPASEPSALPDRRQFEEDCHQLEENVVRMLDAHRLQVRRAFEVLTERVEARLLSELTAMHESIRSHIEQSPRQQSPCSAPAVGAGASGYAHSAYSDTSADTTRALANARHAAEQAEREAAEFARQQAERQRLQEMVRQAAMMEDRQRSLEDRAASTSSRSPRGGAEATGGEAPAATDKNFRPLIMSDPTLYFLAEKMRKDDQASQQQVRYASSIMSDPTLYGHGRQMEEPRAEPPCSPSPRPQPQERWPPSAASPSDGRFHGSPREDDGSAAFSWQERQVMSSDRGRDTANFGVPGASSASASFLSEVERRGSSQAASYDLARERELEYRRMAEDLENKTKRAAASLDAQRPSHRTRSPSPPPPPVPHRDGVQKLEAFIAARRANDADSFPAAPVEHHPGLEAFTTAKTQARQQLIYGDLAEDFSLPKSSGDVYTPMTPSRKKVVSDLRSSSRSPAASPRPPAATVSEGGRVSVMLDLAEALLSARKASTPMRGGESDLAAEDADAGADEVRPVDFSFGGDGPKRRSDVYMDSVQARVNASSSASHGKGSGSDDGAMGNVAVRTSRTGNAAARGNAASRGTSSESSASS